MMPAAVQAAAAGGMMAAAARALATVAGAVLVAVRLAGRQQEAPVLVGCWQAGGCEGVAQGLWGWGALGVAALHEAAA